MSRPLFSQYHKWFVELGYPELDIVEYDDGEWAIIQFLNSTVIPSLCQWQVVLGPMRHVEPTYGICHHWANRLDMTKKLFWDLEDLNKERHLMEADRLDRHVEDLAERASFIVSHTPTLVDRISKTGDMGEALLHKLACHVPKNELKSLHQTH